MEKNDPKELLVLWTSGDPNVAMNMVCMYTYNAKVMGWWEDVTLLVWGSSGELLLRDAALQAELGKMRDAGVKIFACRKCAENMDIEAPLKELGIKVFYTGEFLTEWLRSGKPLLTI